MDSQTRVVFGSTPARSKISTGAAIPGDSGVHTESPKEWPLVVRDFKFSKLTSLPIRSF
jgi:hypothetical protein